MFTLAQMTWPQWIVGVLLIGVCCFLMLVIMLQRGRGGGLAGAFGGAGGMSAFGAKTGDVFTWITVVVAAIFVVLSVLANYALDEGDPGRSKIRAAAPVERETPTPSSVPTTPGEGGAAQEPRPTTSAEGQTGGGELDATPPGEAPPGGESDAAPAVGEPRGEAGEPQPPQSDTSGEPAPGPVEDQTPDATGDVGAAPPSSEHSEEQPRP
ncbi:MAG: preprotein translocase subunit SecG [Phycisphaerae bacterium]